MNPTERYAIDRLNAMTKAVMGHLTPTTLESLLLDLESVAAPMPEDVVQFVACAKRQAFVLNGT